MLNTKKRMAQLAGISLVAMVVVAGFGYGYAFESLYVANDKVVTLSNLQASKWLFKSVIGSFIFIVVLDVVVTWTLYILFKDVNKNLSLITAWLRLVYTGILAASIFHLFSVLPLLDRELPNEDAVMHHLQQFLTVWSFSLIIFGIHLLFLGFVVYSSGFIPKVIGMVALFAGVCYILINIVSLLFPGYELYRDMVDMILSLPMALGELILAVWLIRIGLKKNINSKINNSIN